MIIYVKMAAEKTPIHPPNITKKAFSKDQYTKITCNDKKEQK